MNRRLHFLKYLYYGRDAHTNTKEWTLGTEAVDVRHRRSGSSAQKKWTFDTEGVDIRHRRSGRSAQKKRIFSTEGPLLNQFRDGVKLLIHVYISDQIRSALVAVSTRAY